MDVLVSHDGELVDVCALLRELGATFVDRTGAVPVADLARAWDFVVATPLRVVRLAHALARPETRSLVVAEPGTRAAGRRLHALGVDWVANRPVHPVALRLLLQHALYQGPERRHGRRVTVGLPIRYRARWLSRRALLRELSLRGASLVADRRVEPGRRLTLQIDDDGLRLRLDADVVRCRPLGGAGRVELGLAFRAGPALPFAELRRLLDRHARGPCVCAEAPAPDAPGAAAEPAATACARVAAQGGDRRESARRSFERRVISVGDGAPRVLIGRDLSLGGMRIESGAPLVPGQRVRVALHVRAGDVPLVVQAQVVRADERGAGLRFEPLPEASREYLGRMLDALPALAAPAATAAEEPRVLAELLEAPAGA
jgi:hypothetical protein